MNGEKRFLKCWLRDLTLLLFTTVCLLSLTARASAHEVRPGYLQLHQTSAETYDVLWKVPGRGESLRLGLYVELPKSCTNSSQRRGYFAANAFTEQWTIKCAGGLTGGTIHIAGLKATMTDVLVRLERLDGTTQVTRLTPSAVRTISAPDSSIPSATPRLALPSASNSMDRPSVADARRRHSLRIPASP